MSTNIECQGKPIIFPILYGRRHCIRSWKAQASGDGRLVFCSLGFWNNYIWNRNRMAANWEGIPRPDFGGVRIAWHAVTYTTNYKPTGWIHNYEQSVVLYLLTCQNWHPWSSSIQIHPKPLKWVRKPKKWCGKQVKNRRESQLPLLM